MLFTDIRMPEGMSGYELAAKLEALRPGLRVIYSSGYDPEVAGRALVQTSRHAFLQKPAFPADILEVVRRTLDGSLP